MMTKQQLIEHYCNQILKKADSDSVKDAAKEVIKNLNNRIYSNTSKPLSSEYKKEVLEKVIKNLKSITFFKEAQESEYFLSSVDDVVSFLQPAVEELNSEVSNLQSAYGKSNN